MNRYNEGFYFCVLCGSPMKYRKDQRHYYAHLRNKHKIHNETVLNQIIFLTNMAKYLKEPTNFYEFLECIMDSLEYHPIFEVGHKYDKNKMGYNADS